MSSTTRTTLPASPILKKFDYIHRPYPLCVAIVFDTDPGPMLVYAWLDARGRLSFMNTWLTMMSQASIEYMRYLERCVAELKAANRAKNSPESPKHQVSETAPWTSSNAIDDEEDSADDQDEDMSDAVSPTTATTPNAQAGQVPYPGPPSNNTSPVLYPTDRGQFSAHTSPAIFPADGGHRRLSSLNTSPNIFGTAASHHNHRFSNHSNTTSPSILPSPSVIGQPESMSRHQSFALTSPALGPQPDSREDHEATTALLMLNNDRRTWSGANSKASTPVSRGMSVKDLLSG